MTLGSVSSAGAAMVALLASVPAVAAVQTPPELPRFASDAFLDPVAHELFTMAFDGWGDLGEQVERYTARIDKRVAVSLRALRKDRVVYHSETAVRAFWERNRRPIVQVLGSSARYPMRDLVLGGNNMAWLEEIPFDAPFVPGSDQLFVGTEHGVTVFMPTEDDFLLRHPLAEGADTLYRFRSGDTTTVTLPDGRQLAAVQLDVTPRESSPHLISGKLSIDPASGALVQGVYSVSRRLDVARDIPEFREEVASSLAYRLIPGFMKPLTAEMRMVAVEYSLWDFKVWLPRTVRYEGDVSLGAVKVPVEVEVKYRIESVALKGELAAEGAGEMPEGESLKHIHFETEAEAMAFIAQLLSEDDEFTYRSVTDTLRPPVASDTGQRPFTATGPRWSRWITPDDPGVLEKSPHLPPPIWEDAVGFPAADQRGQYIRQLASLPAPPVKRVLWDFSWGWGGQDLLRYNRVEGPAVGASSKWTLHGSYRLGASGHFGFADLRPKVRLDVERSTLLRRIELGAYHELRATDLESGYLGSGNSFDAFLFGRDNGEYFGVAGADLTWRPPASARQSFSVRAYAERQWAVETNTGFALFRAFDRDWEFRPNLAADEVEEAGGELRLSPWWGRDPERAEFGIEIFGRSAVWRRADEEVRENYSQASATVTTIVPLRGSGWRRSRMALEVAGGHTWGQAPVQRSWFVGGPGSLRGYPASTLSGFSFLRGRVEWSRTLEFFGGSLFGDAGWAGPASGFDSGDILYGIGAGLSIMDGWMRFDLSQGLKGPQKGFRVEVYLDQIL